MRSLRELQQQFSEQIFLPEGDLAEEIHPNGLPSAARLSIYRNNTFTGLSKALAAAYPVIERLVGADFFRHAAYEYIRQHPSQSGDLAHYGGAFPDFLAAFNATRKLVYLPDVARLEQAFNHAYNAADHAPLALSELAQLAPERYASLRFQLHPSASLLQSDYPVARIWEVNQTDYVGGQRVDLSSGACQILIIRPQLAVKLRELGPGEYTLLAGLSAGCSFAEVCEHALQAQENFDVAAAFQRHVVQNTIASFTS